MSVGKMSVRVGRAKESWALEKTNTNEFIVKRMHTNMLKSKMGKLVWKKRVESFKYLEKLRSTECHASKFFESLVVYIYATYVSVHM
jgi:hypothetical protein